MAALSGTGRTPQNRRSGHREEAGHPKITAPDTESRPDTPKTPLRTPGAGPSTQRRPRRSLPAPAGTRRREGSRGRLGGQLCLAEAREAARAAPFASASRSCSPRPPRRPVPPSPSPGTAPHAPAPRGSSRALPHAAPPARCRGLSAQRARRGRPHCAGALRRPLKLTAPPPPPGPSPGRERSPPPPPLPPPPARRHLSVRSRPGGASERPAPSPGGPARRRHFQKVPAAAAKRSAATAAPARCWRPPVAALSRSAPPSPARCEPVTPRCPCPCPSPSPSAAGPSRPRLPPQPPPGRGNGGNGGARPCGG